MIILVFKMSVTITMVYENIFYIFDDKILDTNNNTVVFFEDKKNSMYFFLLN
jgi:hypothetical protein